MYTFYTPSHKLLFDKYLYPSATRNGFEVTALAYSKQMCSMAQFAEDGWRDTQLKKVEYYINVFRANLEHIIIVGSDSDVQILKPCSLQLLDFLKDDDISFQENLDGKICSGFFVARCNKNVIDFFEKVRSSLSGEIVISSIGGGEQYEMWKLIESGNHNASIGKLPTDEIWNPRLNYKNLNELDIPNNIMVHHANWNAGLDSKIKQLDYVRDMISEM